MRDTFERDGFVRMSGVFTRAEADAMCDRMWEVLAQLHGIRRGAPETWTLVQPRHLQRLTKERAFAAMGTPALVETISSLIGADTWQRPRHWGSALVVFPRAGATWDVPHAQWHMDWPARGGPDATLGLRLFAYANAVPPGGGGTCVIAGSHRLVARLVRSGRSGDGGSPRVRRRLLEHPWLRALASADGTVDRAARFMRAETVVDGVPVRVVELTGEPGDVVLMHPWLFHAVAPNCSTAPRLLVGHAVHTWDGLAVFAAPKRVPATVPS
jgi:ectoine hydroxylase-related dioxygenase (phytanoyl-CoA dioxygenase family)